MVNIGEKLRQLRLENNLTQAQVASRLGVAISAVSAYESDTRNPSYESLIKLAYLYHVSTDYLLGINNSSALNISDLSPEEKTIIRELVTLFQSKHL